MIFILLNVYIYFNILLPFCLNSNFDVFTNKQNYAHSDIERQIVLIIQYSGLEITSFNHLDVHLDSDVLILMKTNEAQVCTPK